MGLAIFGNKPVYEEPLYIVRPYLPLKEDIYRIVDDLYHSRWLTNNGRYAREFEEKLKSYLGVKHVLLTSSATIALQLLIKAFDLSGEAIVPSFTFIATAHSLLWEGVKPVFADIEYPFCTIDPDSLDSILTDRTSVLVAVNLFGNPCDLEKIEVFCKNNNLKLIFDSAQALGSSYRGKRLGGFGNAEVFSLHATKIIHSLEGGIISTDDADLYERLVLMQNFGFLDYDRVDSIGINAKMNEFSAAIGSKSLEVLPKIIDSNCQIHARYNKMLKDVPGIEIVPVRPDSSNNYNTYKILINEDFGLSRDMVYDLFWRENIIVRRYYSSGCHKQGPYNTFELKAKLPVTESISDRILCLPCFFDLAEKDIKKIVDIIYQTYDNRQKIKDYYLKKREYVGK